MSGLRDWVRDCIVNCKTSGKLNPANAAEVLTEKLAEHLDEEGGGGSGLPEGGEPYKQLVTDGEGKTVWEDRTHWVDYESVENLPLQVVKAEYEAMSGIYANSIPFSRGADVNEGTLAEVTFDGTVYECTALEVGGDIIIGNPGIYAPSLGTMDYPFLVIVGDEQGTFACYDKNEHTMQIVAKVGTYHRMDSRFMPTQYKEVIELPFNGTSETEFRKAVRKAREGKAVIRWRDTETALVYEDDGYILIFLEKPFEERKYAYDLEKYEYNNCTITPRKTRANTAIFENTGYKADGTPVGEGLKLETQETVFHADYKGNLKVKGTMEGTDVIIASPNGTRYKIAVADDGTLSATPVT